MRACVCVPMHARAHTHAHAIFQWAEQIIQEFGTQLVNDRTLSVSLAQIPQLPSTGRTAVNHPVSESTPLRH